MKLRNMYEGAISDAEGRWRVKVYQLNEQGKWDDRGTGHVSVDYIEQAETLGLIVIDEKDNGTLLLHRISPEDIYHRQEDTIISWTDQDASTDLALSFQEAIGCACIWDQMNNAQRQIQFPTVGDDILHDGVGDLPELPAVELANLPQIAKVVSDVSPFHRDRLAALILRDSSFFRKLLDIFRACEDLEDTEGLGLLFKTFKGITLLNDSRIFDIIFSDDIIMDVVGALEYDPDLPVRQDHRGYLKNSVVFKEAVPIRDPVTKSKIHQTYRIGYIKDVILPRVLDDQTFSTLNSMMLFNNVEVVMALQSDGHFLGELFTRLEAKEAFQGVWKDLVLFLQEFCNLGKHLQPVQRNQLFSSLISRGLFEIVTTALESSDESVRLSGTDILMASLNHDPGSLRSFLVEQPNHLLFSLLVKGMLTPTEGGLQVQLLEMMRMLLDSETMEESDNSTFLEVFYDKYIDKLVGALTAGCSPKQHSSLRLGPTSGTGGGNGVAVGGGESAYNIRNDRPGSTISPEILNNICELLCFCVQHHGFRIKYYVLRNNVVEKVLRLTQRREKYLVVAAVRFLRTCVGLKDEFYFRHLVKFNLFEPIISAFLANGNVYNLLNSAVLELVEYIRMENIKSLIVHLIDNHWSKLQSVDYVETFKQLKVRYEQVKDEIATPPVAEAAVLMAMAGRNQPVRMTERMASALYARRIRDGSMDEDEEAYFNKDDSDDEEDTAATAAAGSGQSGSAGMTTRLTASGGDGSSDGPGPRPQVIVNGTPLDVPLRGAFGLVDYDDEDEEGLQISATVHNEKEGQVLIGPIPLHPAVESPSPSDGEVGWVEAATEGPLGKRAPDTRDGPDLAANPSKRRRKDGFGTTGSRQEGGRERESSEANLKREESCKGSLNSQEAEQEVRDDHRGAACENHGGASENSRLGVSSDDCSSRGSVLEDKHLLPVNEGELRGNDVDDKDNVHLDKKRDEDCGCWSKKKELENVDSFPDGPETLSPALNDGSREENCGGVDRESSAVGRDDRGEECRSEEGQNDLRLSGGDEVACERIDEGKGAAAGNGLSRTCGTSEWEEREQANVRAGVALSTGHGGSDNKEANGTAGHGAMTGGGCGTGNGPVSGKSSPAGGGIKGAIPGGGIGGTELGGLPGTDVRRAETLLV